MESSWNFDYPQIARESGFKLRQIKRGTLDWRLIGSVELRRVLREQDIERLENVIPHLSEAPLGTLLDSNILESGVAKYFGLAQFGLQYLLFCKKFLDETVNSMKYTLEETQRETIKLKEMYEESNSELLDLHKKLQRFEKMNEVVFPCSICTKNFISNEMLNTHMSRKHSKSQPDVTKNVGVDDKNLINTIKLELEIKHLKERLNATEKQIREQHHINVEQVEQPRTPKENKKVLCNAVTQSDIATCSIGIQSNLTEDKEVDEVLDFEIRTNNEILTELKSKLLEFEEWKNTEVKLNQDSVNDIKDKLQEVVAVIEQNHLREVESLKTTLATMANAKSKSHSTENIQKLLNESMQSLHKDYELKLNNIVGKIEKSYAEKLLQLRNDIKLVNDKRNIEARSATVPSVIQVQNKEKNSISEFISESPPIEFTPKRIVSVRPTTSTLCRQVDLPEKPTRDDSIRKQKVKIAEVVDISDTESVAETYTESETSTNISEKPDLHPETPKKQIKSAERETKSKPKEQPKMIDVKKLISSRFESLGLENNIKSLPTVIAHQITKIASSKQKSIKKKYPTFSQTRNNLENLVDGLTKERLKKMSSNNPNKRQTPEKITKAEAKLKKVQEVAEINSPVRGVTTASKQVVDMSDEEEIDTPKPLLDNAFKARLEKVLGSPIRKPLLYTKTRFQQINSDSSLSKENTPKRPVPTPRKKVVFGLPPQEPSTSHNLEKQDSISSISSL